MRIQKEKFLREFVSWLLEIHKPYWSPSPPIRDIQDIIAKNSSPGSLENYGMVLRSSVPIERFAEEGSLEAKLEQFVGPEFLSCTIAAINIFTHNCLRRQEASDVTSSLLETMAREGTHSGWWGILRREYRSRGTPVERFPSTRSAAATLW